MQNNQDKPLNITDMSLYVRERRRDLATLVDEQGKRLGQSPFRHQALDEIWEEAIIAQSGYATNRIEKQTWAFISQLYLLREKILIEKHEKALFHPIGTGFDERVAEIDLLLAKLPNIGHAYYVPLRNKVSLGLYLIRRKKEIQGNLKMESILNEILAVFNAAVFDTREERDDPAAATTAFRKRVLILREQAEQNEWAEKIQEIDICLDELLLPSPDPEIIDLLVAAKREANVHVQFAHIAESALRALTDTTYHMGFTQAVEFLHEALKVWGLVLQNQKNDGIKRNSEEYRIHYAIFRAAAKPVWLARH